MVLPQITLLGLADIGLEEATPLNRVSAHVRDPSNILHRTQSLLKEPYIGRISTSNRVIRSKGGAEVLP